MREAIAKTTMHGRLPGNIGWGYNSILKYFKKSETMNDQSIRRSAKDMAYHGCNGPVKIDKFEDIDQNFTANLLNSYKEIGFKEINDYNAETQDGISFLRGTLYNGKRHSAAKAYLLPIQNRTNLKILKHALVTKIDIDERKIAKGVYVQLNSGKKIYLKANKEVILSAGSVNTPQILMLSGIGPNSHLIEKNIRVIKDAPVGQNLKDHLSTIFLMNGRKSSEHEDVYAYLQSLQKSCFQNSLQGVLSSPGFLNIVAYYSVLGKNEVPDIQVLSSHSPHNSAALQYGCTEIYKLKNDFCQQIINLNRNYDTYGFCISLLKPQSTGSILLRSTDPYDPPIIKANYYSDPADLNTMVRGVEKIMSMTNTTFLKSLDTFVPWLKFNECENESSFEDYIKCYVLNVGGTYYHPIGTAKMGPASDETSVVDHNLNVHGIQKLRVVDASVMPDIPRGNTNAPTLMIAEKAADIIKEEHGIL